MWVELNGITTLLMMLESHGHAEPFCSPTNWIIYWHVKLTILFTCFVSCVYSSLWYIYEYKLLKLAFLSHFCNVGNNFVVSVTDLTHLLLKRLVMLESHYSPLSFSSSLLPSVFRWMRVRVTQALLQRFLCLNSNSEDSFLAFSWTFILHQCSDFFLFIYTHHHTRLPPLIIILMMVQLGLTPFSLSFFCYLFSSCSSLAICGHDFRLFFRY